MTRGSLESLEAALPRGQGHESSEAPSLALTHVHARTHTHAHSHTPHFLPGPASDGRLGPRWVDRLVSDGCLGLAARSRPPVPSGTCFQPTGGSSWDGCLCASGVFKAPPTPVPARCLVPVPCGAWQVLLGTAVWVAGPSPWSGSVCPSVALATLCPGTAHQFSPPPGPACS